MLKSVGVCENDEKNYDTPPDMIGNDYVGKLRKHQERCDRGVMRSRYDALEGAMRPRGIGRWASGRATLAADLC